MDIQDQFSLGHLLFKERKCKSCGKVKDLLSDFYLTRKDRASALSAYSYECKECTIKRVVISRMTNKIFDRWEYPDW
jgi:predicted nucleic acid-binding Zn ribbon protein